LLKILLFLIR